jgi:SMC interacting uncharacterized protein involved in chromosome segregation
MELGGLVQPLKEEQQPASKETVRKFVKDLMDVSETILGVKEELKEAVSSNDEIMKIDEEMKDLREKKKQIIEENPVIQGYVQKVDEAVEDRRQLISDAKQDGVPQKEINAAIKMIRQDIDPKITSDIYSQIADLIE